MAAAIEQKENIIKMATSKKRTPKPKTRTAKPKILRSKSLPKIRKRRK